MSEQQPGQSYDFEQIDADAVCAQCGTVNSEGSLICKTCGTNLRDQRLNRIAMEQGGVPGAGETVSKVRVFTAVLSGLAILVLLAAVLNIRNIEDWLVGQQLSEDTGGLGDVWNGPDSQIYEELAADLAEHPVTRAEQADALENPLPDTTFNGRYVLSRPDPIRGTTIVGWANLSRRGERVHFVARIVERDTEIRGVAMLQQGEGDNIRPVAMNSASVDIQGDQYLAWGYAVPNPDGSHTVYAQSAFSDASYGILAHRVR